MSPLAMTLATGFLLALLPVLLTYGYGNARLGVRRANRTRPGQDPGGEVGKPSAHFRDPRIWAHTGHLMTALCTARDTGSGPLTLPPSGTWRTR